jgi:hypothetical protein
MKARSSWRLVQFILAAAAAAAVSLPAVAVAQNFEIAPFAGLRFGGSFTNPDTGDSQDLDASLSYGLTLGIGLAEVPGQVQILYSHQDTSMALSGGGSAGSLDVDVDVIQIGLLEEFGGPKLRPFLMGTLGATRFNADGYGADVNFSLGMAGGVKYYPVNWLALRVDLRGYGTITEASGAVFCSGGCVAVYSGSMIWQGELTGGFVVSF